MNPKGQTDQKRGESLSQATMAIILSTLPRLNFQTKTQRRKNETGNRMTRDFQTKLLQQNPAI